MSTRRVTNKCLAAYKVAVEYTRQHKYPPSIRDIAERRKTSTSVISYYIDTWLENDMIFPRDHRYRARTIVPKYPERFILCPKE